MLNNWSDYTCEAQRRIFNSLILVFIFIVPRKQALGVFDLPKNVKVIPIRSNHSNVNHSFSNVNHFISLAIVQSKKFSKSCSVEEVFKFSWQLESLFSFSLVFSMVWNLVFRAERSISDQFLDTYIT